MALIDKEFILSDSSVNTYGFRLLTSGYQMPEYAKNPIGYYMHGTETFPREMGVLVKWCDLRIEGDFVYGKPDINMSHPRGQRTLDEVNNGFLNAASLGQFIVIEMDNEPSSKLATQTGPTVTKWFNRECSLVYIPGNMSALSLFDRNDNPMSLTQLMSHGSASLSTTQNAASGRNGNSTRLNILLAQDYDALDRNGGLEELYDISIKDFDNIYFAKHGKHYRKKGASNLNAPQQEYSLHY